MRLRGSDRSIGSSGRVELTGVAKGPAFWAVNGKDQPCLGMGIRKDPGGRWSSCPIRLKPNQGRFPREGIVYIKR